MVTTSARRSGYDDATGAAISDRDASLRALQIVEGALAAAGPGRRTAWMESVMAAIEALDDALAQQAERSLGPDGLLSEIARSDPRFAGRIERLRAEHEDLRVSLDSLRRQLSPAVLGPRRSGDDDRDEPGLEEIDVADVRDRLSSFARRFRQHRSREADVVYEAINVDLGTGD